MKLSEVIWKDKFVNKIEAKHNVKTYEVEQILFSKPHVRLAEKGVVKNENLYAAYGKTFQGRYLIVFFIYKHGRAALPITAREMTFKERRYYDHVQKKSR